MNELIPLKNYLLAGVRASLRIFERRGHFPRPASHPNTSVPYAATLLTVHLAELFLRLLLSFAIGVLIWMLIGSSLIWFRWLLFFLMGCGHVVDVGRTFTYFRLQPNPTSPPPLPRAQPQSGKNGSDRETIPGGEGAKTESSAGDGLSEIQPEIPSSSAVVDPSTIPSATGHHSETGKPEGDVVGALSATGQCEEGTVLESQTSELLEGSGPGETVQRRGVHEFESFSESEPIDTVDSLKEKGVTIPNPKIASIPGESGALVVYQGVLSNLFSVQAYS